MTMISNLYAVNLLLAAAVGRSSAISSSQLLRKMCEIRRLCHFSNSPKTAERINIHVVPSLTDVAIRFSAVALHHDHFIEYRKHLGQH